MFSISFFHLEIFLILRSLLHLPFLHYFLLKMRQKYFNHKKFSKQVWQISDIFCENCEIYGKSTKIGTDVH